ncbi:MAG: hypothetical protein ACREQ9_10905, partial [Candidatus Binatia bacterium]
PKPLVLGLELSDAIPLRHDPSTLPSASSWHGPRKMSSPGKQRQNHGPPALTPLDQVVAQAIGADETLARAHRRVLARTPR